MTISGTKLGKKYSKRWIFRNINIKIDSGSSLAITGSNGSGKSTLLQVLANSLTPSAGTITYGSPENSLDDNSLTEKISFCAPYQELIEEFSLMEMLEFHGQFTQPIIGSKEIMERMGYPDAKDKLVSQFSSGMKQRLKLALCFFYESDVIFLDEPTSNLDEKGISWYLTEVKQLIGKRTILIASNQRYEYDFCQNTIQLDS